MQTNQTIRRYGALLIMMIAIVGISKSQNMQLGDLYLTYGNPTIIKPLDNKTDLIATQWSESDKFFPNHKDFNFSVDNTNDAFLVWQEAQNHNYIKHIRISGDSIQKIEQLWVSDNQDIFFVVSSSKADTITLHAGNQVSKIAQPEQGNSDLGYYLVKITSGGSYKASLFLGYYKFNGFSVKYPNYISNNIPLIVYSSDSSNVIPGTSIPLQGKQFNHQSAAVIINCSDLSVTDIKKFDRVTRYGNISSYSDAEVNYVLSRGGAPVHDSVSLVVRYNGEVGRYADSLIGSKNTEILDAASIKDTLYLIHISDDNTNGYTIANNRFAHDTLYITKWINGVLKSRKPTTIYNPRLYKTKDETLFFYGHTVSNSSDQLAFIRFINGEAFRYKGDEVYRFWGPIEGDSLKWITHLDGNHGNGGGYYYFYADSNAQYFHTTVKSWIDLDPGTYEWQFNPFLYDGKSVIAKYNCYPNAIFTFDQTGQKVEFRNYTSGGITYKWIFGVGSANSSELNPVYKYPSIGDYEATLIAYNECGSDTFSFPISVTEMVSTNELSPHAVNVFPNPSKGSITIAHNFEIGEIKVVDILGQVIDCRALKSSKQKIQINHLKAGCYIVVVTNGNTTLTRKLVVE